MSDSLEETKDFTKPSKEGNKQLGFVDEKEDTKESQPEVQEEEKETTKEEEVD